ncbi:hypothetical protein CF319_g413 [Tilletia indica]|nr:hypothetical protein CF319_g413 [Tilletia indica]
MAPFVIDARELSFARLVGHLSAPPSLPTSQHIRDQFLNLLLHPSLYNSASESSSSESTSSLSLPVPESERWSLLTRADSRARAFAFGEVPSHLFATQGPRSNTNGSNRATEGLWGLFLLNSPQNSLIDPPKQEPDPPILDIWLSQPCRPEADKDDPATAIVAYIFGTFLPAQVREWGLETGAFGKETRRVVVFGYALLRDVMTALSFLNKEQSLGFEIETDHSGRAVLLSARHVWPQPVAPGLDESSSLFMTKVKDTDLEKVWEGANKYYSQEYIAARLHLSCCLRERLTEKTTSSHKNAAEQAFSEDVELSNSTRPIAWSLAHSALSIAATFVVPEWRGVQINQQEVVGSPRRISPNRASDLIILSISREIVKAKLFALWACGLSSTPDTWSPTDEAPPEILDPFREAADDGDQAPVPPWHDMLSVCAESESHNGPAFRMWERIGFSNLDDIGTLEVSWTKFSIPLPP